MEATIYHPSRFLNDHQVIDIGEKCPLCQNLKGNKKLASIQHSPEIELLQCHHCHGAYASKMPKKEILKNYYETYYSGRNSKITFYDPEVFANHLLSFIPVEKKELFILDFGGGDGSILRIFSEKLLKKKAVDSIELHVVDFHPKSNTLDSGLTIKKFADLVDVPGTYDIVIASAILEHIPEVYSTLVNLFTKVRENGFFYARTPFISPFMRLSKKINMTYPAHLHDLGFSFWNRAIETYQLNAECIASRPSIVETGFRQNFLRALASYAFKFPGHMENLISKNRKDRFWSFTGGWEIFLKFKSTYEIS